MNTSGRPQGHAADRPFALDTQRNELSDGDRSDTVLLVLAIGLVIFFGLCFVGFVVIRALFQAPFVS